ncbi:hypothetical protein [Lysobacter antibioticus]|uniref:Uncharacterized protein n=1 Tax=Lysobacter antibioticus TaxID=84531 RepID=A0A0S2F4S6_LYSAN|nr:hypothetical protein [Lysobacter antibioticus]ALN78564.1 hypothetical protein LA76x_0403 [Lysobacter antibioticus]
MDFTTLLEQLVTDFEAEIGVLPRITPMDELYAHYRRWSDEPGYRIADLAAFAHRLARDGFMPCRMADGSLAFLGLSPKGPMAIGGRA